jgi:histone H3/H4
MPRLALASEILPKPPAMRIMHSTSVNILSRSAFEAAVSMAMATLEAIGEGEVVAETIHP